MSGWELSEIDTHEMRKAPDAVPDARAYRNGELRAVVFTDASGGWVLAVVGRRALRIPTLEEVLDAKQQLLPNIENFAIERGGADPAWPVVYVYELQSLPPGAARKSYLAALAARGGNHHYTDS